VEKLLFAFIGGALGFGVYHFFEMPNTQLPAGALVAFESTCPIGWSEFSAASGRVLLASGFGEGLAPRKVGETGGADEVGYTLQTHSLAIPRQLDSEEVINPQGPADISSMTTTKHEMPPFLVVKLCSNSPAN